VVLGVWKVYGIIDECMIKVVENSIELLNLEMLVLNSISNQKSNVLQRSK
jgi:hypothetical protein